MYFKKKSNIIYRNFGDFGYITDNRNYGYELNGTNKSDIGDKIVSSSGAIFLSALESIPQTIEYLVDKVIIEFNDVDKNLIRNDLEEFYNHLEKQGFIVSGETFIECNLNDKKKKHETNKSYSSDENDEESNNTTQDFLNKYYDNRPILTSIHIEITSECNERCIHCYIPHENKNKEIDSELFYNIIEQCRDMNVLNLTISGGEPMLHTNFLDFIKKCTEYNFSINILSNLVYFNEEIFNIFINNPLISVQTSLYSMDENIHDNVTQVKGSYKKTMYAILKLVENNVPLQISCPILKQNMNSYYDVVEFGDKFGISVSSDYIILGRYDSSTSNLDHRVSLENIKHIETSKKESNSEYLNSVLLEAEEKKQLCSDDSICSVCRHSMCISKDGNIYPCVGWQSYSIGSASKIPIREIWYNSDKVEYLRNLKRKDFVKCINCDSSEFCTICMVQNANESKIGNPLERNDFYCKLAKQKKYIFESNN